MPGKSGGRDPRHRVEAPRSARSEQRKAAPSWRVLRAAAERKFAVFYPAVTELTKLTDQLETLIRYWIQSEIKSSK